MIKVNLRLQETGLAGEIRDLFCEVLLILCKAENVPCFGFGLLDVGVELSSLSNPAFDVLRGVLIELFDMALDKSQRAVLYTLSRYLIP